MDDGLFLIAEAGVNHNGSLDAALEMVDVAAEAGADAIKFQTFSADRLAGTDALLADYQRRSGEQAESQLEMLRRLELSRREFELIRERCDARGIVFMSTAFDREELRFLIDELRIPMVKIASGDLTFAPLLVDAGASGLPVILSTGMADLEEIGRAMRFIAAGVALARGRLAPDARLTADVLDRCWVARNDEQDFAAGVVVLHCTTEYPAQPEHLNLRAMTTIAETFGVPVGYSDHSLGALAATVAVARGAVVIEKHFTLDKSATGPDHAASLSPTELAEFVATLRGVETMLGSPVKQAQPVEIGNRNVVRRSLVAARDITEGEMVDAADLMCLRPASGRSAFEFWDVVGTAASRGYARGEYVD